MDKDNFQNIYLERVKKILAFVIDNPCSDFYRKKYAKSNINPNAIKSYDDFLKIPFLTKEEILAAPFNKRLFVPENEIAHYVFSSGTTNQNRSLITPVSKKTLSFMAEKFEEMTQYYGAKKNLILYPPMAAAAINILASPKKYATTIPGDINKLKFTAAVAKEISIEAISSTPSALYFFAEELKKIEFEGKKIKLIRLTGEMCSITKMQYFKNVFPNATIISLYGFSETGIAAFKCPHLIKLPSTLYHPIPDSLLETNTLNKKKDGEIIYTDLTNKAFPLIRYKTSDFGSLAKTECSCGNTQLLELIGRNAQNFLKFHGITLHAQLIEKSLLELTPLIEPNFQAHVYEHNKNNKIMPQIILKIIFKKDVFPQLKKQGLEKISDEISGKLYISANKTLKDLIKTGVFMPLKIDPTESWSQNDIRHKRIDTIISHL